MAESPLIDYYEVLGIKRGVSEEGVSEAFRAAMAASVKSGKSDPADYQVMVEAYRVLSDAGRREEYHRLLDARDEIEERLSPLLDAETLAERLSETLEKMRTQIDPQNAEALVPLIVDRLGDLYTKLQVTKVRVKHKDKQVVPDIPLIYGLLFEAAGLWGAGLVRMLIANLGLKALLDIEVVNEAEEIVARGNQNYQAGEIEAAVRDYRQAVAMDRTCAEAFLQLGIALRVQGATGEAVKCFQRVVELEPSSERGAKAKVQLDRLIGDR